MLFKFLNLTDMLYHGNLILPILLLISQVTEGSGYNCSDFKGHHGSSHPLVECPSAKFMLKDNLVECFDNYTKNLPSSKGQLISKQNCRAITSSKNQTLDVYF